MDEMGWTTWTYALELADRLKLFAKAAEFKTEKDRVSRTLTAWGIFSQQAYKLTRPLFFPHMMFSDIGSGSLVFTS
jgi:hypothetical protein